MTFLVIGLIILALVIVVVIIFRPSTKEEYDQEKYEGKDTKVFSLPSRKLSDLVADRDDKSLEQLPGLSELARILKTDLKDGLNGSDLKIRQTQYVL